MAFVAKPLSNGQVATSAGAIVTGATAKVTYVKKLTLFNTNAASQTIILYINVSGTDRKWRRIVLAQNEHADAIGEGDVVVLEASDTIKAETTTSSAVDYYAAGVEEDV